MVKDQDTHGALQEAVSTLKAGHIRLEAKIDKFHEDVFAKDEIHNKRREDRDKEVDLKFAKVDLKLMGIGVTSAVSPFIAGGVLYPQKAAELVSAIYHLFV